MFCTYVSNLVILAWTADELSCGQASDWYTHRHTHTLTDTQTGAMTIPEGQNWPRVKSKMAPSQLTATWEVWFYLKCVYRKQISAIDIMRTSCENNLKCEYQRPQLMASKHWFREWIGTNRCAITWANVYQSCMMPRIPYDVTRSQSTHYSLVVTAYSDTDLSQHRLRWWLGVIGHQAITWTNVD